jgi:hypothetical protein
MIDKFVDGIRLYRADPVRFTEEIIGAKPETHQAEVLRGIQANKRTTVRSGHGVGKSAVLAWTILWFLACYPYPKIPCTAPTKHQLSDILWAELAKWLNGSLLKDKLIWTAEKIFLRGHPAEWFAVARTAGKPDALQGFHGDNILFVIDEASGVRDELFQPVLGALTTEGAKLVMTGNPTRTTGFFADSHKAQRALFNALKIDGRDSGLVTKESIKLIIDMFGEDSDPFRIRVTGDFPKAEPDSFIPLEWVERNSIDKKVFDGLKVETIDLGVDVARYGDDVSVIYGVIDKKYGKVLKKLYKNDIMETTGAVAAVIKGYNAKGITPSVRVDCDGLGVGVYDRLKELKAANNLTCRLFECHFGGRGGKIRDGDPVAYANSTGLMWGTVRAKLQKDELKIEKDEEIIGQLSDRKYRVDSDGDIVLERKEDMKARGVKSPDIGDALAMALYTGQKWGW